MEFEPLKGVKEFLPDEQLVRERVMDILKKNFKKYSYKPIETSILESYEIASNKYAGGEEILKETYKLTDQGKRKLCLRYELTFKLGKLIALNPTLRFPFKRYEIGKVFRDGPVKKGRWREFTQCDVDVVGIKGVVAEAEFMAMAFDIFNEIGLDMFIKLNNRKLLFGFFESCGVKKDKFLDVALTLDKLEKISEKEMRAEFKEKKVSSKAVDKIFEVLSEVDSRETNEEKLLFFENVLDNDLGKEGLEELKELFSYCKSMGLKKDIQFIPSLSRGLGYYTGLMWEVYAKDSPVTSSIAAGGRWNEMIAKFLQSEDEYPATGMTFGLDVIYTVLKEKGFESFAEKAVKVPQIYIMPIKTLNECMGVAAELRGAGISCDVAFEKKLGKAMDYANKEKIPFTIILGQKELDAGKVTLKDMVSGKEESLTVRQVVGRLVG